MASEFWQIWRAVDPLDTAHDTLYTHELDRIVSWQDQHDTKY